MGSGGTFYVWSFVNYSDDRLKSNEIPITDALTTIMKLNPMTYDKYNNMDKMLKNQEHINKLNDDKYLTKLLETITKKL